MKRVSRKWALVCWLRVRGMSFPGRSSLRRKKDSDEGVCPWRGVWSGGKKGKSVVPWVEKKKGLKAHSMEGEADTLRE